ncbi:MAG: hypothetical protein QW035_02670 [Candidatus Anstonellales archaeon]
MAKMVDKWKAKKWYSVHAPKWFFDGKEFAELISSDESNIIGRKIEAKLSDFIGMKDVSAVYKSLVFRVSEVSAKAVGTELIEYSLSPAYVRTLARRRRSLFYETVDAETKDGVKVRVKVVAVGGSRLSQNTKKNFRNEMQKIIKQEVAKFSLPDFVDEFITGRFSGGIYNQLKKIAPIFAFELRKVVFSYNKAEEGKD